MRRVFIAMSIMFALSWPLSASGDEIKGIPFDGMRAACDAFLEGGDPNYAGVCLGWLIAERNWRQATCFLLEEGEDIGAFGIQAARNTIGHSYEALAQSFLNFTDAHPELWKQNVILTSKSPDVFSEFPCEAAN